MAARLAIAAAGVSTSSAAAPTISGCTASNSGSYFILADLTSVPLLVLGANSASGGTVNAVHVWGGAISGDATWPNHGVPYVINDHVTVGTGTTLTLTQGTEIRFNDHRVLVVNGTLDAQGTSGQHIVFTSSRSTPSAGVWHGIYFADTSINSILDYCEVRYAGAGYNYAGAYRNAGVFVYGSAPTISNSVIAYNHRHGIYTLAGADPLVSSNNSFLGNTEYGVYNADPSVTIDATYNDWGDPSGPYHATTNVAGKGDAVSDYVDYRPWLPLDPLPFKAFLPLVLRSVP